MKRNISEIDRRHLVCRVDERELEREDELLSLEICWSRVQLFDPWSAFNPQQILRQKRDLFAAHSYLPV